MGSHMYMDTSAGQGQTAKGIASTSPTLHTLPSPSLFPHAVLYSRHSDEQGPHSGSMHASYAMLLISQRACDTGATFLAEHTQRQRL